MSFDTGYVSAMAEHGNMENVHTRRIAGFVSGLTYEEIPAEVRERIKLLMLNSLGCAIYGADLEWCRILRGTLEKLDATRTTSIWGTNARLSSDHAALVNGTQVQGFELDDVHRKAVLHVGAVTLPALIAVAESHAQLSGRDFLTAAVAGYEIGPRVGLCMGQEHIGQGWHSGATVGIFSAAAGAARGAGLDAEQTVHALGIAGTQSSGLMAAQYGAMVKRMHAGRAAQSGLYGALLAQGRLYRHRRRVRGALWRLLHHVLALAGSLQSRRAERRSRRTVRDHAHLAEILFLRRQQPHHARRHPRHPQAPAVHARRDRQHRRSRLASHRRSRRLALQARRA